MITIDEARERILARMDPLPAERVPLDEALGRVLAEAVIAEDPLPPFKNSAMDGYALLAADTAHASADAPAVLAVRGSTVAAGSAADTHVHPGEAIRIMTGAPMPDGADSVVMVEKTQGGDHEVRVLAPVSPGENVRYRGEDIETGQQALETGTYLRPQHIALAAALGLAEVRVHRRPRVAIISTGDELVEPGQPLGPGQIRNSNAYALTAEVQAAGGVPLRLGIARDTAEDVRAKLEQAAAEADLIVSTGGVSVGDYDVVKDVVGSMGELDFWTVAMKPGKPLAFGTIAGKPFFGVPGNPSASVVSFEMFIRPSLLKMEGRRNVLRPAAEAVLDAPVRKKPGRAHLVRAVASRRPDGLHAVPAGAQGSAILTTTARANALLVVPADVTLLEAGERVTAILIHQEED